MARTITGRDKAALTQKRTLMSLSSEPSSFGARSGVSGSKAIPHLGQEPGPFCRISGCIGQV